MPFIGCVSTGADLGNRLEGGSLAGKESLRVLSITGAARSGGVALVCCSCCSASSQICSWVAFRAPACFPKPVSQLGNRLMFFLHGRLFMNECDASM